MLLTDFKNGGFPITRRSPVICTIENGKRDLLNKFQVIPAYNRFDLKKIIVTYNVISCVGVWPGKKNSDCFFLDPEYYKIAPPERHKEIDSAKEIIIYYDTHGNYMKVVYTMSEDTYSIECGKQELLNYIKKVGLKFKNRYEKG